MTKTCSHFLPLNSSSVMLEESAVALYEILDLRVICHTNELVFFFWFSTANCDGKGEHLSVHFNCQYTYLIANVFSLFVLLATSSKSRSLHNSWCLLSRVRKPFVYYGWFLFFCLSFELCRQNVLQASWNLVTAVETTWVLGFAISILCGCSTSLLVSNHLPLFGSENYITVFIKDRLY